MKPYRIIIADDHSLIRQGIKGIISKDSSLQIIAEASNGAELLDLLRQHSPEMVIVDITMPQMNGIEAMSNMRESFPGIAILVLTMHSGSQYFCQAIAAGAHGYLMKDDSDTELLIAIKTIKEGKSYISPQMSLEVASEMLTAVRDQGRLQLVVLSEREKQVLRLVVQGYSSKKIAKMLELSPRTIDHHRASLLKKYKMKHTVDLVSHVVRNSLIIPESGSL
jgi:DNA-binding NarL/FixJ family response regulator